MKLACDSCHAKYSVADERVAGKMFKFRCKKCSHVIVLRGGAPASVDTPPPDSGAWHAVVGGEQIGPFDAAELARRREAGELDDAAFVWREGMADWAALGTVDELRAQPSPETAVELAEATRLRNERNETSVLFTLGNLQKLAAEPARPASTSSSASPREEGSGLIDIRALASTWASPAKPSTTSAIDELPSYASTGLADPIVLVPTTSHRGIDRRLLFALIAMLATIAALGTVLVVVLARDGGTAQAAVPARTAVPVSVPVPVVVAQPAVPPPSTPAPAAVPAEQPAVPAPAVRSHRSKQVAKTKQPASIAFAPKQADRCTDVSCAYSDYAEPCCEAFKPRKPAASPTTSKSDDVPDNLDRALFMKGIATFDAQKCGASSSAKGIVSVSIKITAEGKVSGVTIKSTPDPALGTCVEREAKRGTFAKTKRGGSYAYVWRF